MKVIIPIGGGNIENRTTEVIDKYIISLINKENKKVLFIPTASGDFKSYIDKFKEIKDSLNFESSKQIALERENFVKEFLNQFFMEWEGKK